MRHLAAPPMPHSPTPASSRQVIIDTNFINFSIRNKIDLVKVGGRGWLVGWLAGWVAGWLQQVTGHAGLLYLAHTPSIRTQNPHMPWHPHCMRLLPACGCAHCAGHDGLPVLGVHPLHPDCCTSLDTSRVSACLVYTFVCRA